MQIRHCVEESNVDERGVVIDPRQTRHVTLSAGKIGEMSGLVDVKTHLNLDYPDHRITTCVIAQKFEKGAKVKFGEQGFSLAIVSRSEFRRYGPVDFTGRYFGMVEAIREYHSAKQEEAKA